MIHLPRTVLNHPLNHHRRRCRRRRPLRRESRRCALTRKSGATTNQQKCCRRWQRPLWRKLRCCALTRKPGATTNQQKHNPCIEAFMTYRPEKFVECQADYNLDILIFLTGGIGTDFGFALKEVRRKVCTMPPNPMVLFGNSWQSNTAVPPRRAPLPDKHGCRCH